MYCEGKRKKVRVRAPDGAERRAKQVVYRVTLKDGTLVAVTTSSHIASMINGMLSGKAPSVQREIVDSFHRAAAVNLNRETEVRFLDSETLPGHRVPAKRGGTMLKGT